MKSLTMAESEGSNVFERHDRVGQDDLVGRTRNAVLFVSFNPRPNQAFYSNSIQLDAAVAGCAERARGGS